MFEKKDQPVQSSPEFTPAKLYLWVKGLESKVNNLLREVDVIKNDLVKKNNDLKKEVKGLSSDLIESRHEQAKMSQKMDLIIKELKQTAGSEEVTTLKKYIDFWNPIHFVTQRDLERAIDAKMDLHKNKNKNINETDLTSGNESNKVVEHEVK